MQRKVKDPTLYDHFLRDSHGLVLGEGIAKSVPCGNARGLGSPDDKA